MDELLKEFDEALYTFVRNHTDSFMSSEIMVTVLDVLTEQMTDDEYIAFKKEVMNRVKENWED